MKLPPPPPPDWLVPMHGEPVDPRELLYAVVLLAVALAIGSVLVGLLHA